MALAERKPGSLVPVLPVTDADRSLLAAEVEPGAARRLLTAGLECFSDRGFYATTTRDIASHAGMSPAAMYVHYASKGELLYRLSALGHRDALRTMVESDPGSGDPRARLWRLVYDFAGWHARHHRLARVAQYELGAMPPERIGEIRSLRQQVTSRLESEVRDGIRAGVFSSPPVHETARAILSLCIDIARWFRTTGPRTPEELGGIYADLVIRMLTPVPDLLPNKQKTLKN
jgi:AcrR family transcriptional regulator